MIYSARQLTRSLTSITGGVAAVCNECHRPICPAQCPNYQPKVYGECFSCGSEIYDGDTAYNIDGTLYCEDCISNAIFTAEVEDDAEF